MTGRLRLGHNQVTNPEKASLLVFLAEFHRTAAKTMASPVHPEDVVGFESESVWWRPVLHLIGIYGFQMQRPGRGGLLVPQISKSAVSHPALRDKPADCTASWRIRPLDGLPIWKSAIQQVGKPAVRLAQTAYKLQSEPAPAYQSVQRYHGPSIGRKTPPGSSRRRC